MANFWFLVAAAVVATGLLSTALGLPDGPAAAGLTALAGLATLTTVTLAARILLVVTRRR